MGQNQRIRRRFVCRFTAPMPLDHRMVVWPLLLGAAMALCVAPNMLASTPQDFADGAAEVTDLPATESVSDDARAYHPQLNDVRPSSFQDVTPGRTHVDQVIEQLGEPVARRRADSRTVYRYQTGPFESVEIVVLEDLVSSISLRLSEPAGIEKTEAELGLDAFSAAVSSGEAGEPVGMVYPERGVTLMWADKQQRVGHVVLEPILPEPFVLRAEQDASRQYEKQLADLDYAIKVNSTSPRAYSVKAHRLAALGQEAEALKAIEMAIQLAPDEAAYRLQRAELLFERQAYGESILEIQRILNEASTPPVVRARAECSLGDILTDGPHQDTAGAMQHHMAAIKLATPLGTDRRVAVRRNAKRILIDAYLGAAKDVAAGDWRRKQTTIPKWLESAQKLAEGMRLHDGGDETLRFHVLRKSVAAYAEVGGDVDVEAPIDVAVQEAERLLDATPDTLYQVRLRREMAKLMFDAALFEMLRLPAVASRERADAAVVLWEDLFATGHTTPRDRALIGRLYFYIGSTYAIHDQKHHEAVRWYERALPHLNRTAPTIPSKSLAYHGERLVSMGVSYWQVEAHEEAIRLTSAGLEMMQTAAHKGFIQDRALAVPYGNLASMYEKVGKPEEARKMGVLASKLQHGATR